MKKNIILTIIVIILAIILVPLSIHTYKILQNYSYSKSFLDSSLKIQKENWGTTFSIDKITYFSSANANISTNSNSSFTISDLYQYTDIAIFINPNSDILTAKNTLKSVTLNNFNYILKPSYGTPNLYYKNLNNFATQVFEEKNIINQSISFETTAEENIDYSKPVLYNNCANPITLCYVNNNIQKNYTLPNDVLNLSNNGGLLKSCGITLNSISCKISFNVEITNNLDEIYYCPITLNIPLSTEKNTVYDGSLTLKDSTNYRFTKKGT